MGTVKSAVVMLRNGAEIEAEAEAEAAALAPAPAPAADLTAMTCTAREVASTRARSDTAGTRPEDQRGEHHRNRR